jgi:calcineurin-like phosphoesterase family protein
MSQIYVTSNHFFGRPNIIKINNRPYSSPEEMDEDMIMKWNSKVKSEDIVYHLGNLFWDPLKGSEYLERMNGKITLIPTKNDKASIEIFKIPNVSLKEGKHVIELPDLGIVMSHYPMEDWNGKDVGTLHIHGGKSEIKNDLTVSRRFNCSVELWDYYPVEINALFDFIKEFEQDKK